MQLPSALAWLIEQRRFGLVAPPFPTWTSLAYYWAYDSLIWSTTALAGLVAALLVRHWAALIGVAAGVLAGALGEIPVVAAGRATAAGLLMGVVLGLLVALTSTLLTVLLARWWWGRIVVLAAAIPLVADQVRLVDLAYLLSDLPKGVLPPSATLLTPVLVGLAVLATLVCSGLSWFGARHNGFPRSLLVALVATALAVFVLVPLRFALLDLTGAIVASLYPDPGRRAYSPDSWGYMPGLIAAHPVVFALAVVVGAGLSLLLRLTSPAEAGKPAAR